MCDHCLVEDALDLAQFLIDDPRYEFADRFVLSTLEYMKRSKHVTERQYQALQNIRNAVKDKDEL